MFEKNKNKNEKFWVQQNLNGIEGEECAKWYAFDSVFFYLGMSLEISY